MVADTNLNVVIGQGNTITEVHNVRKNVLDSNQQFIAQSVDDKQKEGRSRVAEPQTGDKIEIKGDERRESGESGKKERENERKAKGKAPDPSSPEGNLIDIKV